MRRIAVIGSSGAGKTTLGRWLGRHLSAPFVDLDDLHWRPAWVVTPADAMRAAVDAVTRANDWVVSGNYSAVRDLIWPRADTLVWLDLPLAAVLWRTTRRAVRQWWTQEAICNGNRQALAALVTGQDSLLGYTVRNHGRRQREWPALLNAPAHMHLAVVRLRSQRDIDRWRTQLQTGNTPVDK